MLKSDAMVRLGSVYVAAKYARKPEAKRLATVLKQNGLKVTSDWVDEPPEGLPESSWPQVSMEDVLDIMHADTFLLISDPPMYGGTCGKSFEMGLAYAAEKQIIVIGPRENVFHYLPGIERYDTVEAFLGRYSLDGKQAQVIR